MVSHGLFRTFREREREMYYRWRNLSETGSSGLSLGRRYLRVWLTLCLGLHWPASLSPKIELCSGSSRHRASCRGTFWVRRSFSRMNEIILHTRAGSLTREKSVPCGKATDSSVRTAGLGGLQQKQTLKSWWERRTGLSDCWRVG